MKVLECNDLAELCRVVAALGSGFAYSLVSQGLQGQPMNAITTAAGFAVFQGVFFKVSDHIGNSLVSTMKAFVINSRFFS